MWRPALFKQYFEEIVPAARRRQVLTELVRAAVADCRKSGDKFPVVTEEKLEDWVDNLLQAKSGFGVGKNTGPSLLCAQLLAGFDTYLMALEDKSGIDLDFCRQLPLADFFGVRRNTLLDEFVGQDDLEELSEALAQRRMTPTPYLYIRAAATPGRYALGFLEFRQKAKGPDYFCFINSRSSASGTGPEREVFALVGDVLGRRDALFLIPTLSSNTLNARERASEDDEPSAEMRWISRVSREAVAQVSLEKIANRLVLSEVDTARMFCLKEKDSSLRGMAYIKDGDTKSVISPVVAFRCKPTSVSIRMSRLENSHSEAEIRAIIREKCIDGGVMMKYFDEFLTRARYVMD